MIKGLRFTLDPHVRTLIYTAPNNKEASIVMDADVGGVFLGDSHVTVGNGFRLTSNRNYLAFTLLKGDSLYAICDSFCIVEALVSS
jgi:hypothetical protein